MKPKDADPKNTEENKKEESQAMTERRRTRLPQPDFSVYKAVNAYPGESYFFLGHSFNLDANQDAKLEASLTLDSLSNISRKNTISSLFSGKTQWLPVATALKQSNLARVLSRFEYDLLTRLPESTLIGPAIGRDGQVIAESFTIWRKEMRRTK